MATLNETYDALMWVPGAANYSIVTGDTFNGTVGGTDPSDSVNLQGLVPGTTYTVSVTMQDIAGPTGLALVAPGFGPSIFFDVVNGVPVNNTAWNAGFVTTSTVRVDGNTISFDFTPTSNTSLALELQNPSTAETYAITFAPAIVPGVISEGNDIIIGENGGDKIFTLGGDDSIDGKSGKDTIHGGDGDDTIIGGTDHDQLFGDDGNDVIIGGAGKDKLTGGDGDDTITGAQGNDRLFGGAGNDDLRGGISNDRVYGGEGNDALFGDAGNDKLYGGDGDDVLTGGTGKDVMTGGAGADIFVFTANAHRDRITDFEDGVDLLDFSDHNNVSNMSDLGITQSGAHVVIDHGGPAELTLLNTNIADIDVTDFIF
ncbi:hypothetical protein [uncultured Tateyamaria sp.]|uniref:hypothetical protein n=1 Tax=uncultured Tateyamaria sp. TaxID=455651 RepID=UPI00261265D1|nr:hypothetical protein [uncultured Tateyamaria sp.]